jgi:tRNA G18 (ribose-2'-O)-methylase SpoU
VKVAPIDLPLDVVRAELDRLRHPLSIAVLRAKNPFNVGAIIRVAHSFLVREICLVGDAPFYERAAMGMDRYENLREFPDEAALIAYARAEGLPLVVVEKDVASESLWRCALPETCLLVFGSEDEGVGEELSRAADLRVAIPMYGINHSFPLAIAAGIAMAEWTRRHVDGGQVGTPGFGG